MFEKTLTDVVTGIRASKRDTVLYISQCIAEIKTEINSSDMYVKANALQKLTFLQMMGYSMGWASFASIEVMSSNRFAHKRIAYLAASQGFNQDTDVILLTTNLLKKELRGAVTHNMQGVYEAGLAINCISNIVTEDLARDLLPELNNLTSHPQPYLRKKALLCLFKLFVMYPQGLRLTFAQIQKCLEDQNPSVVSCAVNVITELSDKNPRNYLQLAPSFFQLLTAPSNNWMLLKVVKLLGSLVPEEPRLARKLLDPLANIVRNTQAKSLIYEAVHTITLCLPYCRKNDGSMPPNVPDIVTLCAVTLQSFVKESDQNLKYLGLVGFASLIQSHPRVLSAPGYRPLILACLSDQDVTIRTSALSVLKGMASRKNLMELVSQLLTHVELATQSYKLDLVTKIVEMCSGEKYALLQDFSWYLDVLFQLGHMRGLDKIGDMLNFQIIDVVLRVLPVRAHAVQSAIQIILEGKINTTFSSNEPNGDNGRGRHIMPEILPAIAWIIGEYSDLICNLEDSKDFLRDRESCGKYHAVVNAVMAPSGRQELSTSTRKIYVQTAMKVFAAASVDEQVKDVELEACVDSIKQNLFLYMQSTDVEVQERSFTAHELLSVLGLFGLENGTAALDIAQEKKLNGESKEDLLSMHEKNALNILCDSSNVQPLRPLSVASKCRSVSKIYNYLLKPAPMKPISSKAQRKKMQSFKSVDFDIESPVNIDAFAEIIEMENSHRRTNKFCMESVSFTQQKPLRTEGRTMTSIGSMDPTISQQNYSKDTFSAGNAFQKSNLSENIIETSQFNSRQHQGDPFYLKSAPSREIGENPDPSRFGTIQLMESDEDEVELDSKKEKKRKKKGKRQKSEKEDKIQYHPFGNDGSGTRKTDTPIVYESDEDEDVFFDVSKTERRRGHKKNTAREFEGLANVDLISPLREDEVMPERKHREVHNKIVAEVPHNERQNGKKSKKSKKKDKKKSSKKNSQAGMNETDTTSGVGDLLDLMSFDPLVPSLAATPAVLNTTVLPVGDTKHLNATQGFDRIGSAFGDLLDLQNPVPAPLIAPSATSLPTTTMQKSPNSTKRPLIRASVKGSSKENSEVDWSNLRLLFKVHSTSQNESNSVMISIRVENYTDIIFHNLILTIKDFEAVNLGNVEKGSSTGFSKLGPFKYSVTDSNHEIKGTLTVLKHKASVKFLLPASIYFNPIEGLTLDDLAKTISSTELSSNSARVEISEDVPFDEIKRMLCNYLRSAEVIDTGSGSFNTGTLAAQTMLGSRIFLMLKSKGKSIKIDIKCTNPSLGNALASDIKRLVL